jgi:hypothetical protein
VEACAVGVLAFESLESSPTQTVKEVAPVGIHPIAKVLVAPVFGIEFAAAVAVATSSEPPFRWVEACAVGVLTFESLESSPAHALVAVLPSVLKDAVPAAASIANASDPPALCVEACTVGVLALESLESFPAQALVAVLLKVRREPVPAAASIARASAPPALCVEA